MTYRPREFWEQRLREHFDLRGTGETGLSLAYNRACYQLRRAVLESALRRAGVRLEGARVLDVGCGTGFFTAFYLERGASVTGLDLTAASVERLERVFPQARFVRADIGVDPIDGVYDLVNVFDVFFHVTEDARWEFALRNVGRAVAPGGVLVYTDVFAPPAGEAEHNRTRSLDRHLGMLREAGLQMESLRPTHVLLNRELGTLRFLNRAPGILLGLDRLLLALGAGPGERGNRLLLARRPAAPEARG